MKIALNGQLQILRGLNHAAVAERAISADCYVPRRRADIAGIVNAYAALGTDKTNFMGVHPAQRADVYRHRRQRTAVG